MRTRIRENGGDVYKRLMEEEEVTEDVVGVRDTQERKARECMIVRGRGE